MEYLIERPILATIWLVLGLIAVVIIFSSLALDFFRSTRKIWNTSYYSYIIFLVCIPLIIIYWPLWIISILIMIRGKICLNFRLFNLYSERIKALKLVHRDFNDIDNIRPGLCSSMAHLALAGELSSDSIKWLHLRLKKYNSEINPEYRHIWPINEKKPRNKWLNSEIDRLERKLRILTLWTYTI